VATAWSAPKLQTASANTATTRWVGGIAKHTAQGETRFQYDGPRLLAETGSTLTSHRYDDLGREIGRSQGQLSTDYDYDPLGRLLRQRVASKGQAPLIGRQYSYDTAGKLF